MDTRGQTSTLRLSSRCCSTLEGHWPVALFMDSVTEALWIYYPFNLYLQDWLPQCALFSLISWVIYPLLQSVCQLARFYHMVLGW
jgi:hypothetical protein